MRVLVLLFAILLSFNTATAKKAAPPEFVGTPFPIDEEFVTEFVGYDEKEAKAHEKEQKALLKLDKKRKKIEEKKAKLEEKKAKSVEIYESSQVYLEKLNSSEEQHPTDENL